MAKPLLVLGFGGHGRTVADVALDCGYDEIAFLDDAQSRPDQNTSARVLGPLLLMREIAKDWPVAIAAIGDNAARFRLFEELGRYGFERPNIIHPSAALSRSAVLGEGVFIGRGAIVGTKARIGDATIVNTRASVDHDCTIGAANHIAPGATLSGEVTTGDRVWLGTGCSVRQRTYIGPDIMVGVGAAVIGNLEEAGTYVGVPAGLLKMS